MTEIHPRYKSKLAKHVNPKETLGVGSWVAFRGSLGNLEEELPSPNDLKTSILEKEA